MIAACMEEKDEEIKEFNDDDDEDGTRRQFYPANELIKKLEYEHKQKVAKGKHLWPEQALKIPLESYFICTCCLLVVEEPSECMECTQLSCGDCIE